MGTWGRGISRPGTDPGKVAILVYVANRMEDLSNANRIKYGRDAPETVNALNDRVAEARADVVRANASIPMLRRAPSLPCASLRRRQPMASRRNPARHR